jgi:hypothetical protein
MFDAIYQSSTFLVKFKKKKKPTVFGADQGNFISLLFFISYEIILFVVFL